MIISGDSIHSGASTPATPLTVTSVNVVPTSEREVKNLFKQTFKIKERELNHLVQV